MIYNLFISDSSGDFNILNINDDQLKKAIEAYLNGAPSLTISGEKYIFNNIDKFKIFTFETDKPPEEAIRYYKNNVNFRIKNMFGTYLPIRTLALMGKDVTNDLIGDSAYGEKSINTKEPIESGIIVFINTSRIKELKRINSEQFDLVRLIKLCEEVNANHKLKNFMSVAIISRAILDHVPPIFGFDTFDKVANNYGGSKTNKSIKGNLSHLNISLRNIADKYLHQVIRTSETIPNETQINFSQDLDVLLEEIVRLLK